MFDFDPNLDLSDCEILGILATLFDEASRRELLSAFPEAVPEDDADPDTFHVLFPLVRLRFATPEALEQAQLAADDIGRPAAGFAAKLRHGPCVSVTASPELMSPMSNA